MKVNVNFDIYVTVIEFNEFMGKEVNKYKEEFQKWYFEEILVDNVPVCPKQLKYKYFNAEPIVDWMNEVAPGCNARIISERLKPGEEDTSLQYMYF